MTESKNIREMTVADALELFRHKAEEGKVYNARSGEFTTTTAGTVDQILHTVRRAARRAGGTGDLDAIAYAAVANMLDEHAKQDAIEAGEGNGSNEANRARRFTRTVEGTVAKRRKSNPYNFLREWQPLCDAADRLAQREGKTSRRSYLHGLMELASTTGKIETPHELPDRNTLKGWAADSGISGKKVNKWLSAYRRARAEIARKDPDHGLPDVDRAPVEGERGIRSLPCIVEVADRVGHEGPLTGLDTMRALAEIAPLMHGALIHYLEHCRVTDLSEEWERGVVGAVSRVVASAVRAGCVDVEEMVPADLFLEQVDVEEGLDAKQMPAYLRRSREKHGLAPVPADHVRRLPLLRLLMDEMAKDAAEASPTTLRKAAKDALKPGEVPFYPPTFIPELNRYAALARFGLQEDPYTTPEQLASIDIVKKSILTHMADVNARRGVVGRRLDKDRSLDLVTYPLAVCLGLPAMAKRVHRLKKAFFAAFERHGRDLDHPAVQNAAFRFDALLTEYAVTAMYIADGLREKNYVYARIGAEGRKAKMWGPDDRAAEPVQTHIWPELDEEGNLVRLRTYFRGDDHRLPRLKIQYISGGTKVFRARTWHIRPGIVDFELMTEYLLGTRARNLAKQRLIASAGSYSLDQDIQEWNFALFVSPEQSDHPVRGKTGAYGPGQLAGFVRKSLHWMAKYVLGHSDLPELDSPEWKEDYERVLTGHIVRSMIASYWMGIRGESDLAVEYTNDIEKTLRDNYKRVTAQQIDSEFLGDPRWRRPDFFNEIIDRIWHGGEVIDWDKESPVLELPVKERAGGLS